MFDKSLFILIFTGIWYLVGAVFLAVGFGLRRASLRREERLRARTDGTIAEVVRHERHTSNGRSVSWYPIVEFEVDGHRISLESSDGSGRKAFYEGQRVEVLYDPDDPACFRLAGRNAGLLAGNIFIAVGLGCMAIGIVAAVIVSALPIDPHALNHTR